MNKRFFTVRTIAALGILTALVVALQLVSNYIQFGPVSITLALVPIVVGALLYGPWAGLFLGLVDGAIILTAPSTIGVFMPITPLGTVLICLIKTAVAGMVAGFIFLPFKKRNTHLLLGSILAAISVPIINTTIFGLGFLLLFRTLVPDGENAFLFLLVSVITWNFFVEFAVNSFLSPSIYRIYLAFKERHENEL